MQRFQLARGVEATVDGERIVPIRQREPFVFIWIGTADDTLLDFCQKRWRNFLILFCFCFRREALPYAVVFNWNILYVQIQNGFEEFAPLDAEIAEQCVVKEIVKVFRFSDLLMGGLPFGALVRPIFVAWIVVEEIDIDGARQFLENFEEHGRHGADAEERDGRQRCREVFDGGADGGVWHFQKTDDGFGGGEKRLAVDDAQPVPQVQLPTEILRHKCPSLRKMQLVRKERLIVEKETGELGGQLESAELDALIRIDGGIEILLQNRKIIEAVMRKKIVKPPCKNLLGEEFRAVVWLVCEEG